MGIALLQYNTEFMKIVFKTNNLLVYVYDIELIWISLNKRMHKLTNLELH